tara:strand:+ start:247 stop:384 length:138 start_codon:yes stop_codon:yes gene_type:complete
LAAVVSIRLIVAFIEVNKMTPKEVMEKTYECFASGDMETFQKLHT